jgi:hypothetical protein
MRMKGGPSPRMRALASHEGLSFSRVAVSFSVSTAGTVLVDLSGGVSARDVDFEVFMRSPPGSAHRRDVGGKQRLADLPLQSPALDKQSWLDEKPRGILGFARPKKPLAPQISDRSFA